MKVLLIAWGSRGDVQPFVALGRGLAAGGLDVVVAAAKDFETAVTDAGLGFHPFAVNLTERMQQPLARRWLSGSSSVPEEMRLMRAAVEVLAPIVADGLVQMVEHADVFVCGALTFDAVAPLAARAGKPVVVATMQPSVPTRSGRAMMYPVLPHRRSVVNYGWGVVQLAGTYSVIRAVGDEVRRRCRLPRGGLAEYVRAARGLPTLIGVSPRVVPRPPDWPDRVSVTGYWVEPVPTGYAPPAALADFLDAGSPPVYVGFGSMPSMDPAGLRELVLRAVAASGRRGLLSGSMHTAAAPTERVSDRVLSVGSVPHEWLFPRTAGVVTHGGAGTVGAALRAGVPVGVVSHIADQPYWGRRVHELGVGAAPVPRRALNLEALAAQISTVAGSGELARRAATLGGELRTEDGVATAVARIADVLR